MKKQKLKTEKQWSTFQCSVLTRKGYITTGFSILVFAYSVKSYQAKPDIFIPVQCLECEQTQEEFFKLYTCESVEKSLKN